MSEMSSRQRKKQEKLKEKQSPASVDQTKVKKVEVHEAELESVGPDVGRELEKLQARNQELEAQLQENHNLLLHAKADFENFRRRNRKDTEERLKYAPILVLEQLLPVLDNFSRALTSSESAQEKSPDFSTLYNGIDMVYRQLTDVLKHMGLEVISSVGSNFDPHQHHIIVEDEVEGVEAGIVLEEFQTGYRFADRVIRPAKVKVSK